MRQAAVDYYLAHGKSLVRTMRKMGYPASREYLCDWIDELAPGQRKYRGPDPRREPVSVEKKVQVIAELKARTGPAASLAEKHGETRHVVDGRVHRRIQELFVFGLIKNSRW